jgi:hypothetical protein
MILGMGADWLNTLMGNENFSLKLLKRTLQVSGVKNDKGEYIGLDFHNRLGAGGSVVSFEWTFGFVIAAQRVLLLNPDAEIQNAVNTIREYAKSQELPGNLYKYTDSDGMVDTGFGWNDLGMISLSSSSWALFLDLGIDPFSLITEIGENTITFAEGEILSLKAATEVAAKQPQTAKPQTAKPQTAKPQTAKPQTAQPVSYKVIHKGKPVYLSNNKNFALNLFPALEGERLDAGNVIRLKYDAESPYSKNDPGAPNLLLGLVYSTEVILFTNKRNIAKDPKIILMTRDAANNGWMATLPKTIPNELVKAVAVDFGNKTIFSNWNLNVNNYGNPQFTGIEILKGSAK